MYISWIATVVEIAVYCKWTHHVASPFFSLVRGAKISQVMQLLSISHLTPTNEITATPFHIDNYLVQPLGRHSLIEPASCTFLQSALQPTEPTILDECLNVLAWLLGYAHLNPKQHCAVTAIAEMICGRDSFMSFLTGHRAFIYHILPAGTREIIYWTWECTTTSEINEWVSNHRYLVDRDWQLVVWWKLNQLWYAFSFFMTFCSQPWLTWPI